MPAAARLAGEPPGEQAAAPSRQRATEHRPSRRTAGIGVRQRRDARRPAQHRAHGAAASSLPSLPGPNRPPCCRRRGRRRPAARRSAAPPGESSGAPTSTMTVPSESRLPGHPRRRRVRPGLPDATAPLRDPSRSSRRGAAPPRCRSRSWARGSSPPRTRRTPSRCPTGLRMSIASVTVPSDARTRTARRRAVSLCRGARGVAPLARRGRSDVRGQVVARRPDATDRPPGRRPASSRIVRSQSRAIAGMLWDTKSTVRPFRPTSCILSRHLRWKATSPTASTSSTSRISGSRCAATLNASRRYMPEE